MAARFSTSVVNMGQTIVQASVLKSVLQKFKKKKRQVVESSPCYFQYYFLIILMEAASGAVHVLVFKLPCLAGPTCLAVPDD